MVKDTPGRSQRHVEALGRYSRKQNGRNVRRAKARVSRYAWSCRVVYHTAFWRRAQTSIGSSEEMRELRLLMERISMRKKRLYPPTSKYQVLHFPDDRSMLSVVGLNTCSSCQSRHIHNTFLSPSPSPPSSPSPFLSSYLLNVACGVLTSLFLTRTSPVHRTLF